LGHKLQGHSLPEKADFLLFPSRIKIVELVMERKELTTYPLQLSTFSFIFRRAVLLPPSFFIIPGFYLSTFQRGITWETLYNIRLGTYTLHRWRHVLALWILEHAQLQIPVI
jgi:hypothetical protein